MKLFTTASSLFLGLGAITTAVTQVSAEAPEAGDYNIVNRIRGPAGNRLALTYNGPNKAVSVMPFHNFANQTWAVTTDTMSPDQRIISLREDGDKQTAWGNAEVTINRVRGTFWTIEPYGKDPKYQYYRLNLMDGRTPKYWDLKIPKAGQHVLLAEDNGLNTQQWIFHWRGSRWAD